MRDVFFLALPGVLAIGGIAGMVWVLLRMRRLRAAWRSGITADGRCVSAYVVTTTHGHGGGPSHSTWHHVHEFATPEGEVRRFEEAGGPRTVVAGDRVVVRYPQGRPDQATAIPPSDQGKALFGTGCALAFLTVFVLGALGFMGLYLTVFKPAADTVEKVEKKVTHGGDGGAGGHGSPAPMRPPTGFPTDEPAGFPADLPTGFPSDFPSGFPSGFPTDFPRPPADWPTTVPGPQDLPKRLTGGEPRPVPGQPER
ncbi:DUF3592 domain-containing protein [Streptomyces gamaensis]|uniref:DUF3592 domain-containing protein n=1 Tax=Streptomyces gamaensis TaxID=1763542 RepID=A0ABW0YTL2_9ACTN